MTPGGQSRWEVGVKRRIDADSGDQKSLHLSYILGKTTDALWPLWAHDQEQVCANVTASGQVWNSGCASGSGDYPLQDSQNSFGMSVLKSSHLNHIEGEPGFRKTSILHFGLNWATLSHWKRSREQHLRRFSSPDRLWQEVNQGALTLGHPYRARARLTLRLQLVWPAWALCLYRPQAPFLDPVTVRRGAFGTVWLLTHDHKHGNTTCMWT